MAGKVVGRATDDVQAAVASPSQVGFATTGALLQAPQLEGGDGRPELRRGGISLRQSTDPTTTV